MRAVGGFWDDFYAGWVSPAVDEVARRECMADGQHEWNARYHQCTDTRDRCMAKGLAWYDGMCWLPATACGRVGGHYNFEDGTCSLSEAQCRARGYVWDPTTGGRCLGAGVSREMCAAMGRQWNEEKGWCWATAPVVPGEPPAVEQSWYLNSPPPTYIDYEGRVQFVPDRKPGAVAGVAIAVGLAGLLLWATRT